MTKPSEADIERLARELAKARGHDPDGAKSIGWLGCAPWPRWTEFRDEARTLMIQRAALAAFVTGQKSIEDKSKHPDETRGTTAYRNSLY